MGFIRRRVRRLVRRKVRNPARAAGRRAVARWCPECQKTMPPFHVCVIRADFGRRAKDARRSRARKGAAAARKERRAHDYSTCRDPDCRRRACAAFREGQASCPLSHQG